LNEEKMERNMRKKLGTWKALQHNEKENVEHFA
jgi:hypothetical protein